MGSPPVNDATSGRGDIGRRLKALEKTVAYLRTATSTVGRAAIDAGKSLVLSGGNLNVRDGGGVLVEDGGNVEVRDGGKVLVFDGGQIVATYPAIGRDPINGSKPAAYYGKINSTDGTTGYGVGVGDDSGNLLFGAVCSGAPGDHGKVAATTDRVDLAGYTICLSSILNPAGAILNQVAQDATGWTWYGQPGTTAQVRWVNLPTSSAAANLTLNASTGYMTRSTSSRRYKQDIEDAQVDLDAVRKMRPRTWRDRAQVEADPDTASRYVGFIAEELHDLGLGQFVNYDEADKPEAITYDRLCVALLALAQDQEKRIKTLEDARLSGAVRLK